MPSDTRLHCCFAPNLVAGQQMHKKALRSHHAIANPDLGCHLGTEPEGKWADIEMDISCR